MHKIKNIQRFIAGFLLAIFVLAVTPKIFVHHFFAAHVDNISKSSNNKTPQLTKAGFNCQCDDQVAESCFLAAVLPAISINSQTHFFLNQRLLSFTSVSPIFINLRGPPNKF